MQSNRIIKRLVKEAIDGDIPNLDGSITNLETMVNLPTMWFLVPDIQDKVDNDRINGIQYGPTISRKWQYDDIEHAEWLLQDMRGD